jgi:hypothetical protein
VVELAATDTSESVVQGVAQRLARGAASGLGDLSESPADRRSLEALRVSVPRGRSFDEGRWVRLFGEAIRDGSHGTATWATERRKMKRFLTSFFCERHRHNIGTMPSISPSNPPVSRLNSSHAPVAQLDRAAVS